MPAERERIIKTIELIPEDVNTILDVGCGNEAFLAALPDKYDTVGLDSCKEALRHVKGKAIYGDASNLPFEPSCFDLVTCLEVLEHLPHMVFKKAVGEIQRVSRKYILISVPNNEDMDHGLVVCPMCRCWFNPHRHLRSFDVDGLRSLFDKFTLCEIEEIGPLVQAISYNKSLLAAYRLWRGSFPPGTAICPQCGYQASEGMKVKAPEKPNLAAILVTRSLKPLSKAIWRPKYRHRWLLALYIKQG